MRFAGLLMVLGGLLTDCQPVYSELVRYQQTQVHMGMSFGVVLYAPDESVANRAFSAAFARIEAFNRIFSDYDTESEVSRLCDQAPTVRPIPVSAELFHVLQHAQKLSEQTDGAFDVTVGPLSKLWRRARRNYQLPDPERIRSAKEAVGYRYLILHPSDRSIELLRPKMRLDFGAIVPGYAADEALRELNKFGIDRALVNASGDVTVGAPPPGEMAWKIDIAPLEPNGKPTQSVYVTNASVSTSGDAFQFVEIEGRRYSHILDPKTGYGSNRRSSVTVIAKTGMDADGLATAVSVLGAEKGLQWIETIPGAAVYIVQNDGQTVSSVASRRFEKYAAER